MEFLAVLLINVVKILKYAILVRILLSWIRPQSLAGSSFNRALYEITEPVMRPFRRIMPRTGMIDFSPILAFFALDFAQIGIISIFASL